MVQVAHSDMDDLGLVSATFLLLCVLLLAGYLFVYLRSTNTVLPPGPKGIPLLGYAPFLSKYPWRDFQKLGTKYPDLLGLYMGKQYAVVLQSWKAIQAVIVDQGEVTAGRPQENVEGLKHFSSGKDGKIHGLLMLEGTKWRTTHNFCKETVTALTQDELILKHVRRLIAAFLDEQGSFDPEKASHRLTVDILTELLVGKALPDDEASRILQDAQVVFATLAGGLVNQYPFLKYVPGPFKRGWKALENLVSREREFFDGELQAHRKAYDSTRHRDLLDRYIHHCTVRNGNSLKEAGLTSDDEDDIVSTLMALWSAGGEATLVPILWFVLFMCKHPEVQQKIYDEILQFVGTEREIVRNDRENLPYTVATMYETLRLGLSDPLGDPRSNTEEFYAFSCKIPKRTLILMNLWAVHRDPVYFPNPLEFRPERFLVDGKVSLPPQFMIFSLGVRPCPARTLAETILFLTFANLIQRFAIRSATDYDLPPDDECRPGISGRPLNFSIEVEARPRS